MSNRIFITFFCTLLYYFSLAQSGQKIPLDGNRWYQLTNAERGLQQLTDGDLFTSVDAQYDKIIPLHESYYPLLKGESMTIQGIRFYDWEGTSSQPFTLYIIDSNWVRKRIAQIPAIKNRIVFEVFQIVRIGGKHPVR